MLVKTGSSKPWAIATSCCNMLEVAGVDHLDELICMPLRFKSFADIPVDRLMGAPLIADFLGDRMIGKTILLSVQTMVV